MGVLRPAAAAPPSSWSGVGDTGVLALRDGVSPTPVDDGARKESGVAIGPDDAHAGGASSAARSNPYAAMCWASTHS